jgi:hypothetical protein
MRYLALLAVILLAAGCSPLKHYRKVATDTQVTEEKRKTIAPWVAANFPTETRYVPGDTVVRVDTLTTEDTLYWETVDTVQIPKTIVRYVTKTVTIRDTIYKSDEAKLYNERQLRRTIETDLAKTQVEMAGLRAEIGELTIDLNQSQKQKRTLWWVIFALGAFSGLVVWASIKKII